ncbi:MAG: Stress responsive A/B Barrel Domain protein [Bacteroidetes bacterium ADurb.Bin217]|nr:MAG: Stress responsive A/B Barrel Domain protein [Bacteroidetes bacterium ADurb.Bin217]
MIKHVVMWTFKDHAEGATKQENIVKFTTMLTSLVGVVPGIELLEVGAKQAASPADNYDVVLITEFKTWVDLQAYAVHPEHQKVVTFAKQVVSGRAAVDYEF